MPVDTNLGVEPVAVCAARWLLAAQARHRERARRAPGRARRAKEPSIRDAARIFNTGKSEIERHLKALKENGTPAVSPRVGGRPHPWALSTNYKYAEKNAVRERYEKAVAPLTRPPKDPIKWLQNWDEAFEEALCYGIGAVKEAGDWWRDLEKALFSFGMGMWAVFYYSSFGDKIERNEIQQKKVFDDLNISLRKIFPITGKKVAKGEFPTFGPVNTSNDEEGGNESASERSSGELRSTRARSRSPRPRGRVPKGRKRRSSDRRPTCKVCNCGSHPIVRCYYVFPESAPSYVRLRAGILVRARERLEEDAKLYEEVERYKKRVKKEEP